MIPWYVYAIGGVCFSAAFVVLRKKALGSEHSLNFESTRLLINALLCLILFPLLDFNFDLKFILLMYLNSIFGTIGILLASRALRHGQISLITPLGNIKPVFVSLLAFLFLGESITLIQGMGILIILISMYLLESDHHVSNLVHPIKNLTKDHYSILFILAYVLFSIGNIFDKFFVSEVNIYTYGTILWFFLALNMNLYHGIVHGFKEVITCMKNNKLVFLVSLFSIISWFLGLKAVSMAYVSLVAPVLTLSSLFVIIFGGKFFEEKYLYFRLGMACLMIIGSYLVIA
ncbi:MAG: hypothetical protein MAG795_01003 [Candidatus Woesearchaeota archaeon]|nr:hypothetical protein [Candidatus Woesearchaeota archaeon]